MPEEQSPPTESEKQPPPTQSQARWLLPQSPILRVLFKGLKIWAVAHFVAFVLTGLAVVWLLVALNQSSGSCGRPFRVGGRRRQAAARPGANWLTAPAVSLPLGDVGEVTLEQDAALVAEIASMSPATRAWLAEVWLRDAAEEHASIAAFSRLSLELLAVGAPPDLLSACHHAALDEVRHATHGYKLASLFSGTAWSPSPLPEATAGAPTSRSRDERLAQLAIDSLRDGCLNEGWAAEQARLASGPAHPRVARILSAIAEDEQRHAELAWQILAFCLDQGGALVESRVAQAAATLPARAAVRDASPPLLLADLAATQRAGRLSEASVQATYETTRAAVQPRISELLQTTSRSTKAQAAVDRRPSSTRVSGTSSQPCMAG